MHASTLEGDDVLNELYFSREDPRTSRGPMGQSRLELNKPFIAAIAGPAVAGGMGLALWCDFIVMEESAYFDVYCRRWYIPLIDGGTVRLPRLVGEGRALKIILTGSKETAEESQRIGLCEYVVEEEKSRKKAESLAFQIARFPQSCLRADRRSSIGQHGLPLRDSMVQEWQNFRPELTKGGLKDLESFREGKGRNGEFGRI